MNTTTPGLSQDEALMALAQARDQIDLPGQGPMQERPTPIEPPLAGSNIRLAAKPPGARIPWRGFGARGLVSFVALVSLGLAAFVWQALRSQATTVTASASAAFPTKTASSTTLEIDTNRLQAPQSETSRKRVETPLPIGWAGPELAQSIQTIMLKLTALEDAIDRLKSGQAQIMRDNSELAVRIKATEETSRHNTEVSASLVRDNANLAEQFKAGQDGTASIAAQLKASQDQVVSLTSQLKSNQEQISRFSEQKPKPRPAATVVPATAMASSARKPIPLSPSPQPKVHAQVPKQSQP